MGKLGSNSSDLVMWPSRRVPRFRWSKLNMSIVVFWSAKAMENSARNFPLLWLIKTLLLQELHTLDDHKIEALKVKVVQCPSGTLVHQFYCQQPVCTKYVNPPPSHIICMDMGTDSPDLVISWWMTPIVNSFSLEARKTLRNANALPSHREPMSRPVNSLWFKRENTTFAKSS